jgi:alpha-glucuronidase
MDGGRMQMYVVSRLKHFCFFVFAVLNTMLFAYDGSDAFLHYYAVPENVKAEYQAVCKSLVLSNAASDTLKNAKTEFDLAIPKMLGGAALPVADGAGAIVLAEQGSALVASAGIDYSAVTGEGFIIKSSGGKTYISGKSQVGVLRGAFHFLRLMQTSKSISNLNVAENPCFSYRVLDHWYNHYEGTVAQADRLYGGNRVFKMENFGSLAGAELTRVINYCRMAAALGLNGMCPDNVATYQNGANANFTCLEASNLKNEKGFADIIGTYGLKYYLSVSSASPRLVTPKISSIDAYRNDTAKQWWFDKVDTVRAYIRNFGGFMLNVEPREEEPIPTQSQGANPIAEALSRYGLILILRTYIFSTSDPDFAVNQSKEFASPVQTWDSAVVLRMKDGPGNFQMIEPPHQLLAMPGVRKGMEFQITQEFTGQDKHLCWLVPKWKQTLDWDINGASLWNGAAGTITHQLLKGAGSKTGGVWGISNLSDAANWTGHFLAQANYYGYGRLAWDPTLSAEQIADEWIRCSVDKGYNCGVQSVIKRMLLRSWEAYTDYTMDHSALMPALGNNNHYEIDFDGMRGINFYTDWLMDFPLNGSGIGVERCGGTDGTVHNDFAHKYLTPALADSFCDLTRCPEDYLLFFHHLPWTYRMKGGMTLIQLLQFEHFRGIHEVQRSIRYWKLLNTSVSVPPLMDDAIYGHVLSKLNTQLTDGTRWANTFRTQFGSRYPTQVPCHIDIITPDTTKATEAAVGANIALFATLMSQNGTSFTDSAAFTWSVAGPGAVLTATTGVSTTFSANASGIYTVKVWDSRWPDQFEDELIFVGNWADSNPTGNVSRTADRLARSLHISRTPRYILITSPLAGKISIISLQGRVLKSTFIRKTGKVVFETAQMPKGLYLVQVKNETRTLRSKFFIQ